MAPMQVCTCKDETGKIITWVGSTDIHELKEAKSKAEAATL
jgi:hypothetical protein